MRNASFRLAKDSFRFRCFWASSTPETKRRGEPYPQDEVFELETEGQLETEAAKQLRKSAANPLKSLARVNLCSGAVRCAEIPPITAGRAAFRSAIAPRANSRAPIKVDDVVVRHADAA
jgi:hypothetical protein